MKHENPTYFMYTRKSSESEDRQMASIDDQIKELTNLATKNDITIKEVFQESKSAKAPGRQAYNEMITRIKKGEANGIICWKLNRLARNPIDGGEISWLLQQGIIQHILTNSGSHYPTDNVLMIAVELGMANQFIKDLSMDTKRGLKSKAEKGWYPCPALLGYKNTPDKKKGFKTICIDEERFHLVRRMFKEVIKKNYSASKILEIATDQWGLTRPNGKPLSNSTWFTMLHHPFYYGEYKYNGIWYKGKHKPMITKQEFNQIQKILGFKRPDKPQKHTFPFTGLMRCGECGRAITAEHRYKKLKNGKILHYIHYHCISQNKQICSQGVTHQNIISDQISEYMNTLEIPKDFTDWAVKAMYAQNMGKVASNAQILANMRLKYTKCERRLNKIIDMRANDELSENEYLQKKREINNEMHQLKSDIDSMSKKDDEWIDKIEKRFRLAETMREKFETTDSDLVKKKLIRELSSNLSLKENKVSIDADNVISGIQKMTKFMNEKKLLVRTSENQVIKRKNAPSYGAFPEMLRE